MMAEAEHNNSESASRIDMPKSSAPTNEPSDITNEIEIVELSSPAVNSMMAEAEHNNSESASRVDTPESSARRNKPSEITNEAVNSTITEAAGNNPESGITNGETNRCRIFKVQDVTTVNEDIVPSFKPKILSIGPYHHRSSGLEDMESKKLICLRNILGSNGENNDGRRIMTLARGFYPENIIMGKKDFARMLLLDGCFMLAALGVMQGRAVENGPCEPARTNQGTTSNDTMGHTVGGHEWQGVLGQLAMRKHDIVHDLLLVENQIPFRVLEEIHNLAAGEGDTTDHESLKGKIAEYVEGVLHYYPKAIEISEICSKDFDHLLHLCHMFFRPIQIPADQHDRAQAVTNLQWHRAVQYHEAGVKFRTKNPSTPHSLLDVTFSNGVMEIPRLSIDGQTESLFRNLIMFERGCPHVGKDMNAYVTFMARLLSNPADVELLVRRGIIEIHSHQEEIISFFGRLNGLAVFPSWDDYYLKSTLQSAGAHYNRRSNWWFAWLKHNHLTNPCVALAALAGFIVLICGVIQALFAVLQFFIPAK